MAVARSIQNNTVYNASASGKISEIKPLEKGGFEVSIETTDRGQVVDRVPPGPALLIQVGQTVQSDQPLTSNPNVGGFGQAESEIVLQNPARVKGLLLFLVFVVLTQIFLVLKKKQFEKVQLSEMNF